MSCSPVSFEGLRLRGSWYTLSPPPGTAPKHTHINTRKIYISKQRSGSGSLETLLPADVDVGPRCGAKPGCCQIGFPAIIDLECLDSSYAVTGRVLVPQDEIHLGQVAAKSNR